MPPTAHVAMMNLVYCGAFKSTKDEDQSEVVGNSANFGSGFHMHPHLELVDMPIFSSITSSVMLHRLIRQQSRPQYFGSVAKGCTTCYCRCGSVIRQSNLHHAQQRGAAHEAAPSTRSRRRAADRGPVTHEERRELREAQRELDKFELFDEREREYAFRRSLANEKLLRNRHIGEEDAIALVMRFANLEARWAPRAAGRVSFATPQAQRKREDEYATLFKESGVEDEDITIIASALLRQEMHQHQRKIGAALLSEASNAGNEFATIRLMTTAYNQSFRDSTILRQPRIVQGRKNLEHIDSAPAKVLYGRLAKLEGKDNLAIRLWTEAMKDSVKTAREIGANNRQATLVSAAQRSTSSPWLDLADVFEKRGDYREAKWAIDIGCDLDDPTSHYHAALYYMNVDKHSTSSSKWLYHISKAAASGLPKAMHELGCWYLVSRWPYLEDEVPNSLRPSPFDAYPPERGVNIEETKESTIFPSAVFPNTVKGRLAMALQWLGLAQELYYAPSVLVMARIYLLKTVDEDLAMPEAALKLKKERYRYNSKAEYDAATAPDHNAMPPTVPQVPNPFHDPKIDGLSIAFVLIRSIFFAAEASQIAPEYLGHARQQYNRQSAQEIPKSYSSNHVIWLEYKASYPNFMDMKNGLIYDDSALTQTPDLLAEAKVICDEMNWEVRDDDGRLMYRPNLQVNKA